MAGFDWKFYLMIISGIIGVMLLGGGITGQAISESCCFGPNCSPENLCDSAKPAMNSENETSIYIGLFFLSTSAFLFISRRISGF